ncbi:MAG: cell division protein FtsA [Candidatus Omnitrophica bacterium]|nr:cell division protein FtsA [Candidatus Omnitrophota bacterium]
MKFPPEYILRIGTVKVVCLKIIRNPDSTRKIAGFASCEANGFDRGAVKDIAKAAETLQKTFRVVTENETESVIRTKIIVSSVHLKNFIFASSIYFYGNPHPINLRDVREVIAQTRSVATIPLNEMIIQAVPQEFLVNDLNGICNPIGLEATRLGVTLRLFTMDYTIYSNLIRVFERAEIEVTEFIPASLAAAHAVLTQEEKDEGVIMVDVGGCAMRINGYRNSILLKSKMISEGFERITEALANRFNLRSEPARRLKEMFASAEQKNEFSDELVPIQDEDGKEREHVPRRKVDEVSVVATRELMTRLVDEVKEMASEIAPITQVVFTGGGSKMDGFLDVMQEAIPYTLRLGIPRNISNLPATLMDAAYSDLIGAIDYTSFIVDPNAYPSPSQNTFARVVSSAKRWVSEYF